MIYITGDCHADFGRFAKKKRMNLPFEFTGDDYVIVAGDFGLLWAKDKEFVYNLKWLSRLPFRILWVQGNHENYDMIAEYPLEKWNGGLVRHIERDRIILLERGQVFNIDGYSFFAFGGAQSHDIQGGLLDKNATDYAEQRRKAIKCGLPFRIKHESWWVQELPTEAEMQEGRDNLEKVGYKVDYVISHCLSTGKQNELDRVYGGNYIHTFYQPDILTNYFEMLERRLQYRHWVCGHYHVDLPVDEKHTVLYRNIVPLGSLG